MKVERMERARRRTLLRNRVLTVHAQGDDMAVLSTIGPLLLTCLAKRCGPHSLAHVVCMAGWKSRAGAILPRAWRVTTLRQQTQGGGVGVRARRLLIGAVGGAAAGCAHVVRIRHGMLRPAPRGSGGSNPASSVCWPGAMQWQTIDDGALPSGRRPCGYMGSWVHRNGAHRH